MIGYWGNGAYAPHGGGYGAFPSPYGAQPAHGPHQLAYGPQVHSPKERLTFVLVHGSWADAGFWNGVAAALSGEGHRVYAPEYAGHGSDPNTNVTHADITESVVGAIVAKDLKDIVLVGHSFGGSVVQTTAQRVPDRIKRIVFMDGFVLKDGQSLADQFPPAALQGFEQLRKASSDDTIMLPYPLFRDTFVNLADGALARALYAEIRPEPAKPLFEKLNLKKFYALDTPKSYLFLTGDNAVQQGEGYGWHPHMSSRLGTFRLIEAQGDHMTLFRTRPEYYARKLYEASRD